jgi:hypothetical protein
VLSLLTLTLTTSVQTAGCGKPILLVHGFGANLKHYRKTIPALATQYKVQIENWMPAGAQRISPRLTEIQVGMPCPHERQLILPIFISQLSTRDISKQLRWNGRTEHGADTGSSAVACRAAGKHQIPSCAASARSALQVCNSNLHGTMYVSLPFHFHSGSITRLRCLDAIANGHPSASPTSTPNALVRAVLCTGVCSRLAWIW